ncbi:hypothetical protein WJX79_009758 [Trebouxia sp. C0005]
MQPLRHCGFVGDVTALQVIPLESRHTQLDRDYVAAGMGSQLLIYQLSTGRLLLEFTAFSSGVHVPGIHAVQLPKACLLAVHGERAVKIFMLRKMQSGLTLSVQGTLQIGPFAQWTMDFGLSNNAVQMHKLMMVEAEMVAHHTSTCECSERSLLYSMSLLQQESSGHMWVAAGTIFLDVLVWKVSYQSSSAHPLYRLKGHEGSIHRVSWNTSGTKLMSASDDRTVRLWTLALSSHNVKDSQQQQQQQQHEVICLQAAQVLYGHTSRLWDCQFGEGNGILVTASEDCTARVWDMTSGKQLCSLQGHKGRGVWRCLLHPNQDLLITAGADSSIKLWRLADWLPAHHPLAAQASDAFSLPPLPIPAAAVPEAAAVNCAAEPEAAAGADARVMAAPLPASSTAPSRAAVSSAAADIQSRQAGALEPPTALAATAAERQVHSAASQPGQQDITTPHERKAAAASQGRDSKVEWVRCMKLADESMLFVGTNLGCLYSVSLPPDNSSSSPEWHLLYNSPRKAAITSLQVVQPDVQANPQGANAPAAQHSTAGSGASAGAELQNLWVIFGDIQASSGSGAPGQVAAAGQAKLLAEIRGPVGRGSQIVALDACPKRGLLMCGDMIGTVMGFAVPSELLQSFTAGNSTPAQMQPCAVFRQQHAKSVMIVKLTSTDIMSAGNDGRICRYHWQRQSHSNAVQPQTIQGLAESGTGGSQEQLVCGFQSSDWVVFNTIQQLELMRIPCGGWHRPFTFHCLSPTHLIFVHYQPRSSSIHVHRRRRPVPPLLTPPASDGGPRGLKQGSEGSEGVALGSERGKQRLRELAHWSKRGVDGSYAGASQSPSGQQPPLDGELHLRNGQTQSCSEQNQLVNGESLPNSQQSETFNGQNGSSSRQSLPRDEQEGSTAGGSGHLRGLFGTDEVGFQAAGSAVKSIVTIPAAPGTASQCLLADKTQHSAITWRWLVVTAGAKEVLMAWLLQWNQDCEGKWHLSHHWLSTRPPPRRGLRPVANAKGQNSVSSDLRCMALAGWSRGALPQGDLEQGRSAQDDSAECSSAQAHIITSSSDATMSLVHFDWRTHRWQTIQQLQHHTTPVLCLCTLPCVNAMHAAVTPGKEDCVTLITGGDDQAVHVAVFQLRSSSDGTSADVLSSSLQLTMLCCCHVHSAHTSAIRGIWTDGCLALTVALDQRLHSWRLMHDHQTAEYAEGHSIDQERELVYFTSRLAVLTLSRLCDPSVSQKLTHKLQGSWQSSLRLAAHQSRHFVQPSDF